MTDRDFLALTLYGEARGESLEGKAAVANVIRNRLKAGRWGRSYESVCLAPWQFSCWTPKGGLANYARVKALADAVIAGKPLPDDPVLRECYGVAAAAETWLRDNVNGAQHYLVTKLSPWPSWAVSRVPVTVIGAHSFFVGVP